MSVDRMYRGVLWTQTATVAHLKFCRPCFGSVHVLSDDGLKLGGLAVCGVGGRFKGHDLVRVRRARTVQATQSVAFLSLSRK